MADEIKDVLEQMEVEERRRKDLEASFKTYMESPKGKKFLGRNMDRGFELLKEEGKRKPPLVLNPEKDESLIGDRF